MSTITWTAGTGAEIAISFESVFELDSQGRRKTSGEKTVAVVATVDGKRVQHSGLQDTNHPVAVAKLGPIGLTAENRDRFKAAYAAIEAEHADHNTAIEAREAKLDAATAASKNLETTMRAGE